MAEPRRRVKCPVSECEYTGRIDNAKAHLRSLIVWTLANDDLKCFYGMNRHSALGDAETLCLLSHSKSLGARFSSWVVGFQSLVGPSPIPMVKRRTQSVQRFIPG